MVYKCNISKIKGQFLRNNFVYEVKGSAIAPVLPLHRHYRLHAVCEVRSP